jgi:hypothetical protein
MLLQYKNNSSIKMFCSTGPVQAQTPTEVIFGEKKVFFLSIKPFKLKATMTAAIIFCKKP